MESATSRYFLVGNLGVLRQNTMYMFILIFATFSPKFVATVPQVFSDKYNFCEHEFSNGNKVMFPDKLWTIDTKDFVLYFSFCQSSQSRCRNQTPSCLINKKDNKVVDLGNEFATVDSDEFVLESLNGAKCPNSDQNYKITVTFECSNTVRPKPRLLEENDCNFEVSMIKPDCQPKCTELIHNAYMIDVRNFPKNIMVGSDSRNFSISLCGFNRRCGSRDISSCEIINNRFDPLATIDSQHVVYDVGKNELTARGRYKVGSEHRELQVLIKCKWGTELGSFKYKKVPTQGRNYKFELESSYGCVKLPPNCAIISIDNMRYDLSNLSNPDGWQVLNVPQGKMLLNICGPLRQPKNLCSDQYSQVCHINNNNYVNRGSILSSLTAHDDIIKAVFVSGSTCARNPQQLYSTEIEFQCSKQEKGPVFKEFRECVTILVWESPQACPIDYYKSSNCYMNDRLGNRNLQKLFTESDKIYPLSPNTNTKLVYNLCGPIHTSCNGFGNVSFCLKTGQNRDVIIGWDNREVISVGGDLKLELTGGTCSNNRQGKVTLNFVCSYEEPPPSPQITVIEDGCKFEVKVFTHLACLSESTFPDCVYDKGDSCYDLSPLVYKNRNYVITHDQEVEYILNVCGPIISGPGVLCKGNTMSCLRNKTAVNIKHQFTSIGGVSTPVFRDNSLIIESKMGAYCAEVGYYRTLIYFECSHYRNPPRFLSKEPCTYKFEWKTPEACPVQMNCVINNSKPDSQLDLADLEQKLLKVNVDNGTTKYEFNLCADIYTKNVKDISNKHPLKREFYHKNETLYLVLDLEENCDNEATIKQVVFKLECDNMTENHFIKRSFENCVLAMTVRTRMACTVDKETFLYSVEESIETTRATNEKTELTPVNDKIMENQCLIQAQSTDYVFKLGQLKGKVIYGRNNYSLNFDRSSSKCNGLVCRNNIPILAGDSCPITFFNNTHSIVELHYLTHSLCNSNDFFDVEVWLKCNQNSAEDKVIKNETCKLIVEYGLPEACHLLSQRTVPPATIIGGVLGGLALLCVSIVIIYLNRRHCRRFQYLNLRNHSKSSVPIYMRDSTE